MISTKSTIGNKYGLSILICCLLHQNQIKFESGCYTANAFVSQSHSHSPTLAFTSKSQRSKSKSTSTKLNDLSEWRDQFFEVPGDIEQYIRDNDGGITSNENNDQTEPIREICVLPFPLDDVLLQGETKELCLYEDRFHQLFERSTNFHNSVVAMGLLAPPAGILQNMPLCEIENYRVMNGETAFGTGFSVLVTIRVVGRASLLYIQDEDLEIEYLRGYCMEISDDDIHTVNSNSSVSSSSNSSNTGASISSMSNNLATANMIANRLERIVTEVQEMEDRLLTMKSSTNNLNAALASENSDDSVVSEATMKRRILEAELVSTHNNCTNHLFIFITHVF